MEKFNLNFSGGDNVIKSICWIFSVLSWLLLIVTGWISLRWLDEFHIIWTITRIEKGEGGNLGIPVPDYVPYEPIQMHEALIYLVFILAMIIALAGFIIYMIKSTCKKDDAVFNGMMGQWSKFHFFPLLCISAMFLVGEVGCDDDYATKNHNWRDMHITCYLFDILGLCSLIFIYIMTDLNTDWYVLLTLKKGTYSCFITLLWYYFCYAIFYLRQLDQSEHMDKDLKVPDWHKGCGIAFSIIFGIGSLAFAFIFKDLVVSGMNLLIYLGLTIYYFQVHKDIRNHEHANKYGDGIVDIIMMAASLGVIAFLLIAKKEECLKS